MIILFCDVNSFKLFSLLLFNTAFGATLFVEISVDDCDSDTVCTASINSGRGRSGVVTSKFTEINMGYVSFGSSISSRLSSFRSN